MTEFIAALENGAENVEDPFQPTDTKSGWILCNVLDLTSPVTMFQKFSKCEVKAAQCGDFTILLPLKI